ncbi:unnamed protein product [Spirodela intermedia]|uniref:Uncharacterized protein n=1 Tax=Spirodela intermedia TaxID=51605 RepID=A0A7I8IT87_SPIIN|nr:unnamed protein product [Spirodela intermedia]CAA6661222.1 unnamed protein product [Spirodela intermedia]
MVKDVPVFFLLLLSCLLTRTRCDPRSRTVEIICSTQLEHNTTAYVPNFIAGMQSISDQLRVGGFGVATVGSGLDANYGLAQCYGDLPRWTAFCCFPYDGGRIYLDGCFMRSANYRFFEEYTGAEDKAQCGNTTRKSAQFGQLVRKAVSDATTAAPGNGGYARALATSSGATSESVYVLANCWKTLNSSSCQACLTDATALVTGCVPWSDGRALKIGCFLRYSDVNFLNPLQRNRRSKGITIPIVFAVLSLVVVIGVATIIGYFVRRRMMIQKKEDNMKSTLWNSHLNFKYSTLEKATRSFSPENKLGQGGFGSVYKGVLSDGREIAVKRLYFNNKNRASDFYNEVNMISSVEHKNLVRLLGCSCVGPESLLVYEYVPNKSLNLFIFDPEKGQLLDWQKRLEIIKGTAEGLAYLHENSKVRIIHRDIKASNILLDNKFRARIADFGLARSFQDDQSHITTAIAGTLGYMAPEYLALGQLTEKADVYSFGVLLIEIVTGKSNNRSKVPDNSESIITLAWKHFQSGTVEDLIDPNMKLHDHENHTLVKAEITRAVHIGLLCTQEIPSLRPSSLGALRMLQRIEETLPQPDRPPFTDERTMELPNMTDASRLSDRHPSPSPPSPTPPSAQGEYSPPPHHG